MGQGPNTASYKRNPATVAAALLPKPERLGISLRTSTQSDGNSTPSRTAMKRKARSMKFSPSSSNPTKSNRNSFFPAPGKLCARTWTR